eukprot:1412070-Pyramimonas_sp.AAC.1
MIWGREYKRTRGSVAVLAVVIELAAQLLLSSRGSTTITPGLCLSHLGLGMADLADLGDSDSDVRSDSGEAKAVEDAGDSDSSAEITCVGCKKTNKDLCPVKKKKHKGPGPLERTRANLIAWGKTTRRRGGNIQKSGEWCRICLNVSTQWMGKKKRYKSEGNKKKGLKLLKAMRSKHNIYHLSGIY